MLVVASAFEIYVVSRARFEAIVEFVLFIASNMFQVTYEICAEFADAVFERIFQYVPFPLIVIV